MSLRVRVRCLLPLLAFGFNIAAFAAIPQSERDALIALYDSTNGAHWKTNTGWNGAAGTECTSWFGVTCDAAQGHVVTLALQGNKLSGTLPALSALSDLQTLKLGLNQLSGAIPPLTGWVKLGVFEVFFNRFTGPIPALSGLTNLQSFLAYDNQLTGAIPELSGLTNLATFSVSSNQLAGSIPSLSGLTNLQVFLVDGNQLTGTLPTISGLPNLQAFVTNGNFLTGPIPTLSGMTNLKNFQICCNGLTGSIPSLNGLANLQYFVVSRNQLSGPIPPLDGLTNLRVIYLGENPLSGGLPTLSGVGLDNLEDFEAWNNQLTGTLPSLAGLPKLHVFMAYRNKLTGSLSSREEIANLQIYSASFNQLTGPIPQVDHLTNLVYLNIGDNPLSGTVPSLAGLPNLKQIGIQNAQLSGPLPDLGGSPLLENVYAYENNFTGNIPPLASLKNLKIFLVWNNRLSGSIPSLSGLTNLEIFEVDNNLLSGNIPALTGLTKLVDFQVTTNALTGSLPSLAGLNKLSDFDASYNRLTGSIPSLAGLGELGFFFVENNQLSQAIPPLAGLKNLAYFDADSNQLTGSLPTLSGLTNLLYFDVSNNLLSGALPSLTALPLKQFNVGNNHFSGAIPAVPTPDSLVPGLSSLCPNLLTPVADTAWNTATGFVPCYAHCASASTSDLAHATTGDMTNIVLSGDGSIKVFQSQQTDLTANTGNAGGQDIYSIGPDGKPVLESIDTSGKKLIGTSRLPAISPDGNAVAFQYLPVSAKTANDLITGQMFAGPRGGPKHVVDIGVAGVAANGSTSGAPSLSSANAVHQLVFCSAASNLVANDTNGLRDIFLVNPLDPLVAIQRVSVDNAGRELEGDSCEPKLSSDGTKVVFSLSDPGLFGTPARQIVIKDLSPGKVLLTGQIFSITSFSTGQGAPQDSSEPVVNADGTVVAFTSAADLDGKGPPIGGHEVFVSLAQSGTRMLKRARVGDGSVPDGGSQHPQISDDGIAIAMQTDAKNILTSKSLAKDATSGPPPQCGSVTITTNYFSISSLGGALCTSDGKTTNQNPSISGDGGTGGFDSNEPRGDGSEGRSTYAQSLGSHVENLSGDYSGQWYDPSQNGHGLVIDVTQPDANNGRLMIVTWFVYTNGEPTWVQGVGVPQTGTGAAANTVLVQIDDVHILNGTSFPLGQANATVHKWGSMTLAFTDASTGKMSWRSEYPGFNSGSMSISHFQPVALPKNDTPGAAIKSCYSGNWYNPAQVGHGFEFEVIPGTPPVLTADWFAVSPVGAPVWLLGTAPINGKSATMNLLLINGYGARFPPDFNPTQLTYNDWGTATFVFADAAHATVSWNSKLPGYGSGSQPLQPALGAGMLDRRGCQ